MQRLKQLRLLGRLTKNRTDIAAKHFADAVRMVQKENQKLEDLISYEADYMSQIRDLESHTVGSEQIVQYQNFVKHLEYVIEQQKISIKRVESEVEIRKARWLEAHQQDKALRDYIKKVEDEVQQDLTLKEQKQLDSMVSDFYRFSDNGNGDDSR